MQKHSSSHNQLRLLFKKISAISSVWFFISAVYFLCILYFTGLLFNIPTLTSLVQGWTPMRLITAICLVLTVTSLVIVIKFPRNRIKLIFLKIFCLFNILIGFTSLLVYYYEFENGTEWQFFNLSILHLFFSPINRMAVVTGILFQLTGIIILLLATGTKKAEDIAHALTLVAAFICYIVPVSYILGVSTIFSFLGLSVAMNTGIAFCLICIIILLARPGTWLMKLYTSSGMGSTMARKLLPGLFVISLVIAYFRVESERHGFIDEESGIVLVAVSYTFCFLLLIWYFAKSINKTDEIRKLAEEQLKSYATHLQEANATKDKLFSVIAHDLRSPFTSLLGFSDMLIRNFKNYDVEKIEKIVFHINSTAKSTFVLLENLLIWARSQNGQLSFNVQEINFSIKIQEVIEQLNSLALVKNITLKFTGEEHVIGYADDNMFNVILRNLISNAIKFSYRGGEIQINAKSNQEHAEIFVLDNGVGMSDETIRNLFRKEGSISMAGTAHEKGTGLGLLMCFDFVEKHGGNLRVESNLGKGSKFIFTLPHRSKN